MQKLEYRLASLPQEQLSRGSQWARLVSESVDALTNATRGRSWYGEKKPDSLNDPPATFELAVERLAAPQQQNPNSKVTPITTII